MASINSLSKLLRQGNISDEMDQASSVHAASSYVTFHCPRPQAFKDFTDELMKDLFGDITKFKKDPKGNPILPTAYLLTQDYLQMIDFFSDHADKHAHYCYVEVA